MLKKIRLSTSTNILDRLDIALTPYLIDPISLIGNCKIQWIGIIGPTQSGKSVFLQTAVADMIDQDPGPGLYVLPDENSGSKHLEEKLIKMIEASPALSAHKTGYVRDISHEKIKLDHMVIYPAWATSPVTMNSFPMKRVFLDEVRLMQLSVGNESNAVKLAGDRLTTYLDFGIGQGYMVSSPSIEGDLLHQQLNVPGTLYVGWQVPCPSCGEYQELDFFTNMREVDGVGRCFCRFCNGEFKDTDRKKSWNIKGRYSVIEFSENKWKTTHVNRDGSKVVPYTYGVGCNRVFFHWDSLVSPFRSFATIWNEYKQTKGKLHDYKNFWQCWLGRFWIEDKSRASTIALEERKKDYEKGDVPPWTKILTAGIDTQDNGFYVVIRAWGGDKNTALVDEFFIPCAMETTDYVEIANLFNNSIFNRVLSTVGSKKKWKIALCAIDSGGHRTKQVYGAGEIIPRLLMIKGAHATQRTTIQYSKEYNLYLVRTSEYLDESDARSVQESYFLPSNTSKDYLIQFCNIRKTDFKNKKTGTTDIVWRKVGQCDFRLADVHSYICLDIPTDRWGNLRAQLEAPDFKCNPFEEEQKIKETKINPMVEVDDQMVDYQIDSFNW